MYETLRQRLHRNCRARQIGRLRVTFPMGRQRDIFILIIFIFDLIFQSSKVPADSAIKLLGDGKKGCPSGRSIVDSEKPNTAFNNKQPLKSFDFTAFQFSQRKSFILLKKIPRDVMS